MHNTRIMFFGTPEFAESILQTLIDMKANVVAVVSQPDRPVGRKHIIQPTPTHALANEHNIPCIQPEKLSEAKEEIFSYEPELILTCAYGQFVPTSILNYPRLGCINIHPSLLPRYRGASPMQYALLNGDKETGVSIMEITKEMDAGKVYAQCKLSVGDDETLSELSDRLNKASCDLLKSSLQDYIDGKLPGTPQSEEGLVIAPSISKEQEQLHFQNEDVDTLYNHARALIDWPVPYALLEGKRVKFYKVRKENKQTSEKPGTVIGFEDHAMIVACNGGILKVYELQYEGKKRMDADAFKNGYAKEVIGKVFD